MLEGPARCAPACVFQCTFAHRARIKCSTCLQACFQHENLLAIQTAICLTHFSWGAILHAWVQVRWTDASLPKRLCVRVQEAGWLWSGGVALDSPGDLFVKIRHRCSLLAHHVPSELDNTPAFFADKPLLTTKHAQPSYESNVCLSISFR